MADPSKRFFLPALFLLALATLLAYLPSLSGDFVWDARNQILHDDYLHDPAHFADVLSLRVLAHDVVDANRPVQLLSLMVDSLLWGRNPAGYRFTNLLLHFANAVLVLLLSTRILLSSHTGAPRSSPRPNGVPESDRTPRAIATFGAFLFALHPLASEPVSSVGFREDLLVTFFTLLSLQFAFAFAGRHWKSGAAVLLCVFLAVASKETGIAAVVTLAVLWRVFGKADPARGWLALLGGAAFLATAFLSARFLLSVQDTSPHFGAPVRPGETVAQIAALQLRFWTLDLKLLLWPSGLSAVHGPLSLRHIPLALAIPAVALTLGLSLLWIRRDRRLLPGAAIAGAALLPVSNLVPLYFHVADRYLYLPLAGFALCLAPALQSLSRLPVFQPRPRRHAAAVTMIALLAALGIATQHRATVWSQRVSLWNDTVAKNPHSAACHNSLALALYDQGAVPAAVDAWQKAARLSGERSPRILTSLALALESLDRKPEAEESLRKALALDPSTAGPETLARIRSTSPEDAARLQAILTRLHE